MQKRSRGRLWIAGIWTAIALVNATQNLLSMRGEGVSRPLAIFFTFTAFLWLPWVLATPVALRMALRFPPVRGGGARVWFAHLAVALAIGLVWAAWGTTLNQWVRPFPSMDSRPWAAIALGRFLNQFHINLIVYAGIVAIAHNIESRRRAAALEAQLSQTQLDALRRQLEPHFLFNTLNAVAGLIRDGRGGDAIVMISGVSDLLRRVVDQPAQQVPLGEEMDFLERYLEIQHARFAARLRVHIDVPAELRAAQVPSLILQPLVENAIQHGIGQRVEGGELRVAAGRLGAALEIRIANDGPPLVNGWQAGVGLSNTRARLASLYGAASGISVENREGGVEVVVTMPYATVAS